MLNSMKVSCSKFLGRLNLNRKVSTTISEIRVYEVGPRDGLQNEQKFVPTEIKIELIEKLAQAGIKNIESASFVSPKWVKQMSDGTAVMRNLKRFPGVNYPVLVPNVKGYETAMKCNVEEIAIFPAGSEGFSQKNLNCSVEEGIKRFKEVADQAIKDGIRVRGYVSCVVGCPYDGAISPKTIAKEAGASCVKFQKTCLKEKFTKKYLERPYDNPNSWGKTYGEHKSHLEFSESQYRELIKYAQEVGILFTASAMDMVSFDFLVNIKAPFIKIGSGDSNNLLFLKYAASKKVPLIISTGMVDKRAVKTIYDIISEQHKQFCLLHCVSAYPVPYEDCNLTVLQDYKNTFDVPVGYSGQEIGTAVALAAVALGAKVLEKHITLDKDMKGTDHVCSLTPTEFKQLVQDVRVIEAALGTPIKKVVTSEIPCIDKLQKSLVMGSTKNKGEILYPGDVKIKVAEPKGLNALHFEEVIYKTLVYDKKEDEPLYEGDFC